MLFVSYSYKLIALNTVCFVTDAYALFIVVTDAYALFIVMYIIIMF